ncbi:MAG TPA: hypothetical protein PLE76_01265 [Rectinema sp.]|nr:hypothetical protein [Rectinema sp.]HOO01313.1 hypothetical protein [Rectinema sp.]HOR90734.1 hypothetical protein [Rectinema sp.]HOU60594.1 hypothetical protein [Rectinema sp.]
MALNNREDEGISIVRPKWPAKFANQSVDCLGRKLKRIFDQNASSDYFTSDEIRDYSYYERLLIQELEGLDQKISKGKLKPSYIAEYPRVIHADEGKIRACIYIGSFDPFQLTHLTVALRFLASDLSNSDFVVIVPEGSPDTAKPLKTDYAFRYSIAKMQIEGIFDSFIKALDLGMQADTIEIIRRFIAMHSGYTLELTHLIGSDALPIAASLISEDMRIWRKEAQQSKVDYQHSIYVVQRGDIPEMHSYLKALKEEDIQIIIDPFSVEAPSSSDFRTKQAYTIVLPTASIRERMEIIFRYHLHKSWSSDRQ